MVVAKDKEGMVLALGEEGGEGMVVVGEECGEGMVVAGEEGAVAMVVEAVHIHTSHTSMGLSKGIDFHIYRN